MSLLRRLKKNHAYQFYRYRLWQLTRLPYFAVTTSGPGWRYLNREALRLYRSAQVRPDSLQQRIVQDLEEHGIAVTHLDELFGADMLLRDLSESARELTRARLLTNPKKMFLLYFLRSDKEPIDFVNPFAQLALEPKILALVSAYLKVFPRLRFLSGNIASPMTGDAEAEGSQRWHRDPGVYKICKMFMYLNDVDEGTGPFTYVAGSQPGGRLGRLLPHRFFGQGSYYPKEGLVEQALREHGAENSIRTCTGRAGTVIFCNTMGLHKGGYATQKPRTMMTAYYEATASIMPPGTRFTNTETAFASLAPIVQEALK